MEVSSWIENDMIFVTGGHGYGIHPLGATICLGTVEAVKEILHNSRTPAGTSAAIKETFEKIFVVRKEIKDGKFKSGELFKAQRVSRFRNRPTRNFEHRAVNTKRTSSGKVFPGHKIKQQKPSVLN